MLAQKVQKVGPPQSPLRVNRTALQTHPLTCGYFGKPFVYCLPAAVIDSAHFHLTAVGRPLYQGPTNELINTEREREREEERRTDWCLRRRRREKRGSRVDKTRGEL